MGGLSVPAATLEAMTELHVHVPDDVAGRLAAAAAERGTSTEDVAADVLTQHAPPTQPASSRTTGHRLSFIGLGASGRSDLSERTEEILRAEFGA